MNSPAWLEAVIILFIIGGIVFAVWKGGATNPVGTGGLNKRLTAVDNELIGMRSQIDEIEERVEKMDGLYAKASDIDRLERRLKSHDQKLDRMAAEMTAIRENAAERAAMAKATAEQVRMIYMVITEKGMNS